MTLIMTSCDHETIDARQISTRGEQIVSDNCDTMNLLDALIVLAEKKIWISKTTGMLTALVVAIVLLLPNQYAARTRILPPQQNQLLATSLTGQLAAMSPLAAAAGKDLGLKNPNDLYVGILESETVADALISRFRLQDVYHTRRLSDAREELERASSISTGKDGFITISVEDRSRTRAAQLANGYVDELRACMRNVAVTQAGQRRIFLGQQLAEAKNNLEAAEAALRTTQERTGIIQIDGQAQAIIESVSQVRAQIAAKEVQLRAMRSFGTEQNPDVMLANQELAGLRVQLGKLERQSNLGAGDLQVPTGKIPEFGLEYIRRTRDVKYYENIFELLAKQFEAAKLDEAQQGAIIQVIDPALEPEKRSSPKRLLLIAIGFFVSLTIAAASVLFLHSVRQLQRTDSTGYQRLMRLRQALLPSK